MPLSSMTGFARTPVRGRRGEVLLGAEKRERARPGDRLRLPPGFDHLEADIRGACARAAVARQLLLRLAEGGRMPSAAQLVAERGGAGARRRRGAAARRGGRDRHADRRRPARHPGRAARRRRHASTREAAERRDAALHRRRWATGHRRAEGDRARRRARGCAQCSRSSSRRSRGSSRRLPRYAAEAPEVLKARIREQVALLIAERTGSTRTGCIRRRCSPPRAPTCARSSTGCGAMSPARASLSPPTTPSAAGSNSWRRSSTARRTRSARRRSTGG